LSEQDVFLNVVSFHYTNNCCQGKKTYLPKCENVGRERGNKNIFKYGLICPINYIKLINLCCRKPQDIFITRALVAVWNKKYKFLPKNFPTIFSISHVTCDNHNSIHRHIPAIMIYLHYYLLFVKLVFVIYIEKLLT
jgi:hypothetical protein